MSSDKKTPDSGIPSQGKNVSSKPDKAPGWADGLRKLYDSVVDEPIPDSFKDLLSQFDESGTDTNSQGDGA